MNGQHELCCEGNIGVLSLNNLSVRVHFIEFIVGLIQIYNFFLFPTVLLSWECVDMLLVFLFSMNKHCFLV